MSKKDSRSKKLDIESMWRHYAQSLTMIHAEYNGISLIRPIITFKWLVTPMESHGD